MYIVCGVNGIFINDIGPYNGVNNFTLKTQSLQNVHSLRVLLVF